MIRPALLYPINGASGGRCGSARARAGQGHYVAPSPVSLANLYSVYIMLK